MGLDAVVYKNIRTLEPGLRERIRIADSATGQLEFLTQGPPDPNYNDELLAVGVRIGNAALVDWLRGEFRSRWDGRCQGILETVLFSSSHSGDFIALGELDRIRREIEECDLGGRLLPQHLTGFFEAIRKLLDAAEAEGNPIVFV